MRFCGAGFLWISLTLIGVILSSELHQRCNIFKAIMFMTESFSSGINCYLEPINKIIHKLCGDKTYEKLDFLILCGKKLTEGCDFPCAWEEAVKSSKLPLRKNEKQELINFGLSLGRTDLPSQNKILGMYNNIFLSFSKKADDEKNKYGTATIAVGFLLGSLLFILLL